MKYNINEILGATSGYIYYKSDRFDEKKEYFLSGLSNLINEDNIDYSIYIPIKVKINGNWWDRYNIILDEQVKLGVRAFMFDEIRFCEKEYQILTRILENYKDQIDLIIMVPDTLKAISDIAYYTRAKKMSKKTKYIAVTGTIAKTSTTEMLYGVLSLNHKVYRGAPTVNLKYRTNHKFLETDSDVDFFLCELSGHIPGYMKMFSELLRPDGAIVTKISNENLEQYHTKENVAREKTTLLSSMGEDGVAVINAMDILKDASKDYICKKVYVEEGNWKLVKETKDGIEFIYKKDKYFIPVVGLHQVENAIRVIELLKNLNFSTKEIKAGLANFKQVGDRWLVDKYKNNVEFITDCPNNPSYDTIVSACNTFIKLYKDVKYKRFILTKIISLGNAQEETFKKIQEFVSKLPIQEFICVDYQLKDIAEYVKNHSDIKVTIFERPEKIDENAEYIKYLMNTMDKKQAILLKGLWLDVDINYGDTKYVLRKHLHYLNK